MCNIEIKTKIVGNKEIGQAAPSLPEVVTQQCRNGGRTIYPSQDRLNNCICERRYDCEAAKVDVTLPISQL